MKQLMVITGATSGIGLACVSEFLLIDDLYVLALGRNLDKINLTQERLIKSLCDVSNKEQVDNVVTNVSQNYQIVGLINAAGVVAKNEFTNEDHVIHQSMIDVNVVGLTNMTEAILPIMRKYNYGTVMNLSSLADRYPRPSTAVYAATKAYVKSLSDSLRVQNAKYNIRVMNIAPALIETPMVVNGLGIQNDLISVSDFVKFMKVLYLQPQNVCIRDVVIAPTNYVG